MVEHRAAVARAKEAKQVWKDDGYANKPGQAALAGPSAVREEPHPPSTASASVPVPATQPEALVPATREAAPDKSKRKRRTKKQIEDDNAAAAAAKAARAVAEAAVDAEPAPVIRYDKDGVALLADFDELVSSKVLPLPEVPAGTVSEKAGQTDRYYASRCQELRTAVKKYREMCPYRELSEDEMHFWNALGKSLCQCRLILSYPTQEKLYHHHSRCRLLQRPAGFSRSTRARFHGSVSCGR